jgi:hypothetical protein
MVKKTAHPAKRLSLDSLFSVNATVLSLLVVKIIQTASGCQKIFYCEERAMMHVCSAGRLAG